MIKRQDSASNDRLSCSKGSSTGVDPGFGCAGSTTVVLVGHTVVQYPLSPNSLKGEKVWSGSGTCVEVKLNKTDAVRASPVGLGSRDPLDGCSSGAQRQTASKTALRYGAANDVNDRLIAASFED